MKKLIVPLLALVILLPGTVSAILGVPFGGRVVSTVPCACNPDVGSMLITYVPFFTIGSLPIAFTFYYSPAGARPYANFIPGVPGSWMMGSYTPGTAVCLEPLPTIPPSCAPIPFPTAVGVIREFGASIPTFR